MIYVFAEAEKNSRSVVLTNLLRKGNLSTKIGSWVNKEFANMKINLQTENVKRQIHLLAEIVFYGIEWNRDLEESEFYRLGGLETTAFTFSCCVVQWFGVESLGAGDVMNGLELESLALQKTPPTISELKKKILSFLKEL